MAIKSSRNKKNSFLKKKYNRKLTVTYDHLENVLRKNIWKIQTTFSTAETIIGTIVSVVSGIVSISSSPYETEWLNHIIAFILVCAAVFYIVVLFIKIFCSKSIDDIFVMLDEDNEADNK